MCGSAGLWAPSCIASAQIAVAEVNNRGGILDRKVELIMIDAALEAATPVEEVINSLIEIGSVTFTLPPVCFKVFALEAG